MEKVKLEITLDKRYAECLKIIQKTWGTSFGDFIEEALFDYIHSGRADGRDPTIQRLRALTIGLEVEK